MERPRHVSPLTASQTLRALTHHVEDLGGYIDLMTEQETDTGRTVAYAQMKVACPRLLYLDQDHKVGKSFSPDAFLYHFGNGDRRAQLLTPPSQPNRACLIRSEQRLAHCAGWLSADMREAWVETMRDHLYATTSCASSSWTIRCLVPCLYVDLVDTGVRDRLHLPPRGRTNLHHYVITAGIGLVTGIVALVNLVASLVTLVGAHIGGVILGVLVALFLIAGLVGVITELRRRVQ